MQRPNLHLTQLRRANMCYANRVSPSLFFLKRELEGSDAMMSSKLLTALALSSKVVDGDRTVIPPAWIYLRSIPTIAKYYVMATTRHDRHMDGDRRNAQILGEIAASWSVPKEIALTEVQGCRSQILEALRTNPPPEATVLKAFGHGIYETCKFFGTARVSKQQLADALGCDITILQHPNYSMMTNQWFAHRMNCINWDLVQKDQICVDFIQTMNDINQVHVNNLPEASRTLEISQQFNLAWTTSTDDQILAFYELLGHAEYLERRRTMVSAYMIFITSLVKGSNVTEEWLTKRLDRVSEQSPDLRLADDLNINMLKEFNILYPKSGLTADDIYNMLATLYTWVDEDDIGPVKWIIEQSATSNITSAVSFANAITKSSYNGLTYLVENFGQKQFQKLSELIAHMLYDPFCSIIEPPVQVKEYADLAYIGVYAELMEHGRVKTNYQGSSIQYTSKPIRELKMIADTIHTLSARIIEDGMSLQNLLISNQDEHNVIVSGDDMYEVEGLLPAPTENSAADYVANYRAQQEDLQRLQSATLPHNLRNLSVNLKKINSARASKQMNDLMGDYGRSVMMMLNNLTALSFQRKLPTVQGVNLIPGHRQKALPANIIAALGHIGVTIRPEWVVGVHDDVEQPMAHFTEYSQICVLSRNIVAQAHGNAQHGAHGAQFGHARLPQDE